jgi:hypothetical protein
VLLELARQYADIIQAIEVERFRSVGTSYEFRALITLHDGSQLFVKITSLWMTPGNTPTIGKTVRGDSDADGTMRCIGQK